MPTDYLVRYGRAAFVGRFRDPAGRPFARGDAVAVRSVRGTEAGEVLAAAGRFDVGPVGDLVGPLADSLSNSVETDLLAAAQARTVDLPVTILDCERLIDPVVILHVAAWAACDLTIVLEELSSRFDLAVRVHHLGAEPAAPAEPATGCGKPDCGGGGCTSCSTGGCSTGGCSRGAVKTADDLTAYFAGLRQQMEAAGRVPLH
jgi:hypothetical protein